MDDRALLYPMFAMVLLTATTLARLFTKRLAAVRAGTADARYFKTYQEGSEPVATAQLSRNFSNLFEAPVLFYVACVSAMVTGLSSGAMVGLAWLYVLARVVHSWIHTGPNSLNPRIAAYFASWLVLVTMWIVLVLGAATGG